MIRGKRLISGFLIGIMVISLALTAGATDIKDMKKEQQQLQEQLNIDIIIEIKLQLLKIWEIQIGKHLIENM